MQQSSQKKEGSTNYIKFEFNGGSGGGRNQRGGRSGRSFGRNGNKVICQLCDKPGHTAARCWHRLEQNYAPPQSQPRANNPPQFSYYNPAANLVQAAVRLLLLPMSVSSPSEYSFEVNSTTSWYPDSGATNHVSNDLNNLNISSEYTGGKALMLGNGDTVSIANIGESAFDPHVPNSSRKLHLRNLLHVPNITKNLLSVSQFARDNQVFFEFHSSFCFVKDLCSKELVLKGVLNNGLYQFLVHYSPNKRSSSSTFPSNQGFAQPTVHSASLQSSVSSCSSEPNAILDIALWHSRLGHPTLEVVKITLKGCNIPFNSIKIDYFCQPCCVSKAHRLPYTASEIVFTSPLEFINSHLWGPVPILSRNGFSYYVSFIDHYTRHTWIYLLKLKSDVIFVFKQFNAIVENLCNTKIKALQSDWGGECQGLTTLLKECGISHRLSCPHTPQQNDLAKRKHYHIVETGLALLSQSSLPAKILG